MRLEATLTDEALRCFERALSEHAWRGGYRELQKLAVTTLKAWIFRARAQDEPVVVREIRLTIDDEIMTNAIESHLAETRQRS